MDISDYAKKEIEKVKCALPKMQEGDVRFAFITDLHYKFINEVRTAVCNLVGALNELNNEAKIDFVCFGGDNVGNYPNSKEEHIEMMKELASLLTECRVPCIFVQGNHDDNSIHGIDQDSHVCKTGFEVENDVQYDVLFSHEEKYPEYHKGGEKALYGYFDSQDTRFIFLNSNDVPHITDDNGILKYVAQHDFGYGADQISWLCNTALKNAPKNVIFIEHAPFDELQSAENRRNSDALDKIIKAFANGERITVASDEEDFEFSIDADFSGERHNIPARIAGHCHFDSATTDKNGFLSITTMLAGRKNAGVAADMNGVTYEREPYSAYESSMDIFTFSPSRGKLYATRYGSGKDRTFDLK